MENRDINHLNKIDDALDGYSTQISRLRGQALDIANSFLEKPPSYWENNDDEARATFDKLHALQESGRYLEDQVGSCLADCDE